MKCPNCGFSVPENPAGINAPAIERCPNCGASLNEGVPHATGQILIVAIVVFFMLAAVMGACALSAFANASNRGALDSGVMTMGAISLVVALACAALAVFLIYLARK